MQFKKLSVVSAVVVSAVLLASPASSVAQQTLLWSDEFDGTSLDTTKWDVVDQEDWYDAWYAPHNVEVSDGTLKLHSQEELYNGKHWTGAKLEGTYHPEYAYLEARVRHSAADAHIWSAWWTIGWENNTWKWPPEFDIFEFGTQFGDSPLQTYHWDVGYGHDQDGNFTYLDETEWHTYGVYWTESQSAVFYVDGLISYVVNGPAEGAQMPAFMLLSSSPNRDDHYKGNLLADLEVDYVRVYDQPPVQPEPEDHLALNKPAVASSSQAGDFNVSNVFDGDTSSRWASNWSDPQWIRVDLQDTYEIDKVRLLWETALGKEYKIQVADDPNGPWTDGIHVTNNGIAGWVTHEFAPVTGRYVRFYGMQRGTEWGYSLYEFEVYGDLASQLLGDINGDGFVGLDDLDMILNAWNTTVPAGDAADPSGDGYVGLDDLDIVLSNWNAGSPPADNVPEPAGLMLLSIPALLLKRRR